MENLQGIRDELRRFVDERDWGQFHTPKNLVMALSAEVGELTEHFQWSSDGGQAVAVQAREAVVDEMADVAIYLLHLANALDVDLVDAISNKLSRNRARFPVKLVRGRAGKPQVGTA